ncbi:hypothetical protein MACK_001850 [Theileria orientalis]|uniref:C2H2-type domain-containing protein n=1 Tax=Theileria orientalis TaxID=68886 RepID=A0A976QTS1_THEOR|nr:hypothetical protein MACK_001850 [Theileria orientalis]
MNGFSCDQCGSVFTNASNMRRHKRFFHSNRKGFKCERCDVMFTRSDHLKRHYRSHNRFVNILYCDVNGCKKRFTRPDKLDSHRKLHMKRLEEGNLLDLTFPSDVIIVKGLSVTKRAENDSTVLVCPYDDCGKQYGSYSGIVKHINFHLDPPKKDVVKISTIVSCDGCAKTFKTEKGLEHHTKAHHSTDNVQDDSKVYFICPHEGCRKIYTTPGTTATRLVLNAMLVAPPLSGRRV